MTQVLVVNHDIALADEEVDALRRRGYDVRECLGPIGTQCPVLAGRRCDLADSADVLVYDAWVTGEPDGARRLIEGLRNLYPAVPVVLTAAGIEPEWMEAIGDHNVTPLVGSPTGARLAAAIEDAIARTTATGTPG